MGSRSSGQTASEVVYECHKNGLLILSCGPYDVIRMIPPLNITADELAFGFDIFKKAVLSVQSKSK
jgi:4-aminobutyrate aminotransferase